MKNADLLNPEVMLKNYASDQSVARRIEEFFPSIIREIRASRSEEEARWYDYYNIWINQPNKRYYYGRADIKIGAVPKTIERWVSRTKRALIPSEDWFSVTAEVTQDEDNSQAVYLAENHYLKKKIKYRRLLDPLLRQYFIFGTCVQKDYYKKEKTPIVHKVREKDLYGYEEIKTVVEEIAKYDGPFTRNVPLFNFYVWPETANFLEEARMVFEEALISDISLRDRMKSGWYVETDIPSATSQAQDKFYFQQQIMSKMGFRDQRTITKLKYFAITEIYTMFELFEGEDPVMALISMANDVKCIQARVYPFWIPSLYRVARFRRPEGEFYGHSITEPVETMVYELNDKANQTLDNASLILNPVIKVDPGETATLAELQFSPGAKWQVTPEGVQPFVLPDLTGSGFNSMGQVYGLIQELTQPGPVFAPRNIKSSRSASIQSQSAIEADMEVLEVAQAIEEDILEPMLYNHHGLMEQFMSDDLILMLAGPVGHHLIEKRITPKDIIGQFGYRWLGSMSSAFLHVKVQQMLLFLNIVAKVPPQEGFKVNVPLLLKKIWRDGLGFKDDDKIVIDVSDIPSIDPEMENEIASKEIDALRVSPKDDDAGHLKVHDPFLATAIGKVQAIMKNHVEEHIFSAQLKQLQQQQAKRTQMAQAMGMLPPQPQGKPQKGGVNNPPTSVDEGNILRVALGQRGAG